MLDCTYTYIHKELQGARGKDNRKIFRKGDIRRRWLEEKKSGQTTWVGLLVLYCIDELVVN